MLLIEINLLRYHCLRDIPGLFRDCSYEIYKLNVKKKLTQLPLTFLSIKVNYNQKELYEDLNHYYSKLLINSN